MPSGRLRPCIRIHPGQHYNKNTELIEAYSLRNNGQDSAVIVMALMMDSEFSEHLPQLESDY